MTTWKNRALTLQLTFTALALGCVHTWAVALSCVMAIGLFLLEVLGPRRRDVEPRGPGITSVLAVALVAFTALQILPLPSWLVAILSPQAHEIRASLCTSLLASAVPGFMPISIDVSGTLLALMKVTAAAMTFIAVRQRVRMEGSRDVLWCVVVSGLFVAVVSLLHRLTGWDRVYDIYEPLHVHTSPLPAPFLNSNHLAGALGLSVSVTVGLALDEQDMYKRVSLLVAAGFTGAALLLTLSRGGILCFIAGQVLFIVLRLYRKLVHSRSTKGEAPRELAALPLALGVAVAAGSYVALRSIVQEFTDGDTSKFRIWQDAFPMLRDYWLTGSGRGTFQLAYTAYQKMPDEATYTHPENFLTNWLGDWGMVAGSLIVLYLAAVIVLGLLRPPRRSRNAGALVALFALLVQNFADFGLELPGILLPTMVCLGVETVRLEMWAERKLGRRLAPALSGKISMWLGLTGATAAIVLVGAGLAYLHGHSLDKDDARLRGIDMEEGNDSRFEEELARAMARHPADYHLPQLGGIRRFHGRRGEPLPLLERSLDLFPRAAVSHLYVARTLARMGRVDQALVEYMETVRWRPSLSPLAADEVIALAGGFDVARRWARMPADRPLVYEALAEGYLRARMPDEARLADEAALRANPLAVAPLCRTIRRYIEEGMHDEAVELARRLATVPGEQAVALFLEAEVAHARGNDGQAIDLYKRSIDLDPGRRATYLALAKLLADRDERDALMEVLASFVATAKDERSRGEALLTRAGYELKLGMSNQALSSYIEASMSLPDSVQAFKAIAQLQEKRGDSIAALAAYRELARIEPDEPRWQTRIEEIVLQAKNRSLVPSPAP